MMLANITDSMHTFATLAIIVGILWMALDAIRGMRMAGKKVIKVKTNDRGKTG